MSHSKGTQSLANRCKALCVPFLSHHASSQVDPLSNAKLPPLKTHYFF
ncbi:TPA_asm: hypothetical protein G4Y23_003462 [Salmonella enterica subsp. enterica serovar Braenderup]|uniref:Uncharacterized protein n=1 Tax=Salmonella enterica subsp. enterica serovar Braenderup TaxID=149391 RepID=A0A739INP1_SALET|nr:hypothetical protein [Salmonella enterica subsp. enterica serovar Braenderup]HAE9562685.1 hypothetical protein [Salmonella enterica subsp. enterica serovar Braenderup]